MKKLLLLLLFAPTLFFSCDKVEDATSRDIDTSFDIVIPVSVTNTNAIVTKSSQAEFAFSESKTFKLSENTDINKYLDNIKGIDVNQLTTVFNGLQSGQKINKLDISVTGANVVATFENVTGPNTSPKEINVSNLKQAGVILNNTKEITVTVSGTTNEAPMNFSVALDLDVTVTAGIL